RLSMNELYEECVPANCLLECLTTVSREKAKWQSSGAAERWMQVLQAADIPNIQAILPFVLSILSSGGFVENIFSIIKNKWTDVRNKCSTELMRSELIVSLINEMSCSELSSNFILQKE
ncbi:hypothetical protein AMECASPLE_034158, partial [Ameca splendens]